MFNFLKKADSAKTIETSVSQTPVSFKDIRPQWKALAQERKITKEDIAALCIYRALVKGEVPEGAKTRLHKAFRPITNQIKIANGAAPYAALDTALYSLKYSAFAKWLSEDEMKALIAAAKTTKEADLK